MHITNRQRTGRRLWRRKVLVVALLVSIVGALSPLVMPPVADAAQACSVASRGSSTSFVLARNRNLRTGPALDCRNVTQLDAGTVIAVKQQRVRADGFVWAPVSVGSHTGWLAINRIDGTGSVLGNQTQAPSLATPPQAPTLDATGDACQRTTSFVQGIPSQSSSTLTRIVTSYNARSGPGADCNLLGVYSPGELVAIIARVGNWRQVRNNRGVAWVHAGAFRREDLPKTTFTSPAPSTPELSRKIVGKHSGKCIEVPSMNPRNGHGLQIASCDGGSNQQWEFRNGTLRLAGKCLDVRGPSKREGTPAQLWSCEGVTQQSWKLTAFGGVQSLYSGLCLDVRYGVRTTGARIELATCDKSSTQYWTLTSNQPAKGRYGDPLIITCNWGKTFVKSVEIDFTPLQYGRTNGVIWKATPTSRTKLMDGEGGLSFVGLVECIKNFDPDLVAISTPDQSMWDQWSCHADNSAPALGFAGPTYDLESWRPSGANLLNGCNPQ